MKVLGRDKLVKFSQKHAPAKSALDAWFSDTESNEWKTPQDIKDRYRSADFLADNRVIFNIKGNNFRLVVKVRYQNGIVVVEWVGTHAEYSKKRF
ncbi:type II toxin-antitoxin system HigB family toxin [bacterium endosymbiont of Escarpia laminata]|nr:MAG: type II toxin-antitoxin system HigB family toxin [bacterium endosymbiont of Escarpia laminata]